MTTIIQNFTLVSLNSYVTPHLVGLPLGAAILSLLHTRLFTHSSPYVLISLRICLPTHSSYRYVCVPAGRIFRLGIYLRLFTCWSIILDCHSTRQGRWVVDWMQLTLFLCVIVSLVISQPVDQSNWLDDERSPSVCHQFDDKGPPSVCHQVFREAGSMTKVWRISTFSMSSG